MANGVSLALGKLDDGAVAEAKFAKQHILPGQETGTYIANVTVTFSDGESVGPESFAHEGSHVADRQDLVAAWAKAAAGDSLADGFYLPENLTTRQTESRAYRVSAA